MFAWLSSDLVAWVPVSFFLLGPWAQIRRNYYAKNTGGLSHRSVFLVVSGLSCIVLYNFFMHLPLAYRVMHPLVMSTWLVLAYQEYIYRARVRVRRNMRLSYGALAAFFICMMVWGQSNPLKVGTLLGWLAALLLAVFQVPQVVKNHVRESVAGLSYTYLTILSMGSFVELSVAYWNLLPLQSVLNASRGICFYIIFVYQYFKYRRADLRRAAEQMSK